MHTFPSASYDDWKLMSPDEEAERLFGPQAEDEDDEPDIDDEFEEALANCHQFCDGGRVVCGAVGSEDCDFCPFHDELGKPCQREDTL